MQASQANPPLGVFRQFRLTANTLYARARFRALTAPLASVPAGWGLPLAMFIRPAGAILRKSPLTLIDRQNLSELSAFSDPRPAEACMVLDPTGEFILPPLMLATIRFDRQGRIDGIFGNYRDNHFGDEDPKKDQGPQVTVLMSSPGVIVWHADFQPESSEQQAAMQALCDAAGSGSIRPTLLGGFPSSACILENGALYRHH